ncbi:hypothetical protein [Hymenobacter cavernae]|uniref:Uncharacterized protein n=1 Tax=Hymenobacter cavernae TaxID=2044852 RepID=A0ABQ1UTD4_9BACT|nr:hypothetical protein [Hymenobacter cavernae]GGF26701.1 hypothetical protein GCM10011383_42790 [Hymenobacter cavernae]
MSFYKVREDVEQAGSREVVPLWEYDIEADNSQSKLSYDHFPQTEPNFSRLLITGSPTDVITDGGAIGGSGLIVSDRLKNLLASFRLGRHRFYPLDTFEYESEKKPLINYSWLQIISEDFYKWIDYDNSDFFLFDDFEEEIINHVNIKTPGGLLEAIDSTLETDNSIIYKKLIFNNHYTSNPLDLFYTNGISDNIFTYPIISERLKDALQRNSITGLELKQVPIYLGNELT